MYHVSSHTYLTRMSLRRLYLVSVLTLVVHFVHCNPPEQLLKEYEQAFDKMPTHAWPYIRAIAAEGRLEYCRSYYDKVVKDTGAAFVEKNPFPQVGVIDETHNVITSHTVSYRMMQGEVRNVDTLTCGTEIHVMVRLVRSAKAGCVHGLKYTDGGWRIRNETCNFCPEEKGSEYPYNTYRNMALAVDEDSLKEYESAFSNIYSKYWPNANAMEAKDLLGDYCRAIFDRMATDYVERNGMEGNPPPSFDAVRLIPYRPYIALITVVFRKIPGSRQDVTAIYCITEPQEKSVFVRSARNGCVYATSFRGPNGWDEGFYIIGEVCNLCS